MRNKKKMLVILLLLVVGISIGYAAITTTLNINGNTKIEKASWDVHFENLVLSEGIVDASVPAAIDSTKTVIDYTINLAEPGDFYEFTVDIVNSGSLDAKIIDVLKEGLTTDQEKYIDYSVKYTDGDEVVVNGLFKPGKSRNIIVSVKYKEDVNAEDLPTEEETLNLSFSIIFGQDDGTGVAHCDYEAGEVWTFSYKGSPEEFVVPCDGTYKMEVWGAQGGNAEYYSTPTYGGFGGYSSGNVELIADNSLFVVVGGKGRTVASGTASSDAPSDATSYGSKTGGYNGGGSSYKAKESSYTSNPGSGGGATHIGTFNSTLANHGSADGLYIVAGGGGGAMGIKNSSDYYSRFGGAGGGLSGVGNTTSEVYPGTQTDGYAFGSGQSGYSTNTAGGGGGFYGGYASTLTGASNTVAAAGGSGYIGGVSDGQSIAGNKSMPTHDGTSTMTGNSGDGFAKITLVSID